MFARSAPCSPLRALRLLGPALLLVALSFATAAEPQQRLLDALTGNGSEAQGEDGDAMPALAERIVATDALVAELDQRLVSAREKEQTALVTQLERERELLALTQLRQRQIETALGEEKRLSKERADRQIELDAFLADTVLEADGATFFTLEKARDALDSALERSSLLEKTHLAALRQRNLAQGAVSTAQREQRRASDAIATAGGDVAQATARQIQRERELATAAEAELLRLRQREVAQAELRIDVQKLVIARASALVERLESFVSFTEEDFGQTSEELDARLESLRARRDAITARQQKAEEDLAREVALQPEGVELTAERRAQLDFYRLEQDLSPLDLDVVERAIERTTKLRSAWLRRKQLSQSDLEPGECADWDDDAKEWLTDLEVDESIRLPQLEALRAQLQDEQGVDRTGTFFDTTRRLQETVAVLEGALTDIASGRRVIQRLRDEITAEEQRIPLLDRLRSVGVWIKSKWDAELIPLNDSSITVRKVVLGLTIVFVGAWLAKRFSRLLGSWLARRFQVDKGELAVAQTLTFYLLVVLFCLFALKVADVPLTAFTIFGGAIAIGVGFGSQNLINNFISGLILLLERPIRVGDLIQVDELQGNVERIGARSTVVRTGSNIEIVVPNSTFLEQQVINWTLTEPKVRVHVRVGVAYGSPTREVAKLLRRAAEEHGRILKTPEPIVLFEDFGDDALIFEVHFWIRMRRVMDRRTIESDVRFIIDGLFNGAGITIAFPQRDVHLDTAKPLEVRVLKPQEAPESSVPNVSGVPSGVQSDED